MRVFLLFVCLPAAALPVPVIFVAIFVTIFVDRQNDRTSGPPHKRIPYLVR